MNKVESDSERLLMPTSGFCMHWHTGTCTLENTRAIKGSNYYLHGSGYGLINSGKGFLFFFLAMWFLLGASDTIVFY